MHNALYKCIAAMIFALYGISASDGLLRYDVFYDPYDGSVVPAFEGYMVFNDVGPMPGNIWSNIVDWRFTFNSVVFDPTTTAAGNHGYFEVDEFGYYAGELGVELGPGGAVITSTPCFSTSGNCSNTDTLYLSFSSAPSLNGAALKLGSQEPFNIDFSGVVSYSSPSPVPTTPTAMLLLAA